MAEPRKNGGCRKRLLSIRMKLRNESNKRVVRWFLWASLALYMLSSYSYLLGSSTTADRSLSLPQNIFAASRALAETSHSGHRDDNAVVDVPPAMRDLKIYVYDLPAEYTDDWLSNPRCSSHLFAAEVAIHRALLGSRRFRTLDPWQADFFFVPVYVSCNFSTVNGFPAIGHARQLLASAVQLLSSELPFWNRSGGADHVFTATHDFGPCFHTLEDVAIADGIPAFLRKSIILQTFGVKSSHPCQEVENVVIPPYVSPESLVATLERGPAAGERDIWVFFRGKMEVHPKNVSGRFYSKSVRTKIWHQYKEHPRFYLKRKRFAGYQAEMLRSVFCLCPLGWAPWSPRLVEAVALGCVPVIIADGIRLPFSASIPWPLISVSVPEKDVHRLDRILLDVVATNLSAIQRNLWDPSLRRALLFYAGDIRRGDATWHVLEALSGLLLRSERRRAGLV